MPTSPDIRDAIREYIVKRFPLARKRPPADHDPLTGRLVDSLGMLDVIQFVESRFAITIAEDEFVAENFETIDRIAALVESKRGASRDDTAATG